MPIKTLSPHFLHLMEEAAEYGVLIAREEQWECLMAFATLTDADAEAKQTGGFVVESAVALFLNDKPVQIKPCTGFALTEKGEIEIAMMEPEAVALVLAAGLRNIEVVTNDLVFYFREVKSEAEPEVPADPLPELLSEAPPPVALEKVKRNRAGRVTGPREEVK